MVSRIEIGFKKGLRDALGEKTRRRIMDNFKIPVEEVKTIDVYTIEGDLDRRQLRGNSSGTDFGPGCPRICDK